MWPNPEETADLVTFTDDIFNGKHFLCSVMESGKAALQSLTKLFGKQW